ncbi:hypothetical protein KCU67_g35, partial [Aureobasidium melanogenum]
MSPYERRSPVQLTLPPAALCIARCCPYERRSNIHSNGERVPLRKKRCVRRSTSSRRGPAARVTSASASTVGRREDGGKLIKSKPTLRALILPALYDVVNSCIGGMSSLWWLSSSYGVDFATATSAARVSFFEPYEEEHNLLPRSYAFLQLPSTLIRLERLLDVMTILDLHNGDSYEMA